MTQIDFANDVEDIFYGSIDDYVISAVFYLTQHCNLACPDCYMRSSPNIQKTQISTDDIKFYLGELKTLPNFLPGVAFSGGEIFTLPLSYIKENIENAFAQGICVELKTNGTWVMIPEYKQNIFNMVREINIPKHLFYTDYDVLKYFVSKKMTQDDKKRFRRYRLFHRNFESRNDYMVNLAKQGYNIDLRYSPLAMSISVDDDVIHRANISKTAYLTVLNDVVKDEELRQKISLGRVTIVDSNKKSNGSGPCLYDGYAVNVTESEKRLPTSTNYFNGEWIKKPRYKSGRCVQFGLINLFFYPDRTVSLYSDLNLQPIGRVSYIKNNGEYKKMPEIMKDITNQLILDYQKYQR